MTTQYFRRLSAGIFLALVMVGCTDYPDISPGRSDDSALPQPSGNTPVPPPSSAPATASTASPPPQQAAGAPAEPMKPRLSELTPTDSTPDATSNGSDANSDVGNSIDNLEMADDSLNGKLSVLRVGSGRTDSNLLTVFASVKNRTSHPLAIEVQTIYKDKSDNALSDGKAGWVPITLQPHEEFEYRSVAISDDADDFLVRIRGAPAASP